jgi:hypothetical protein
MVMVLLAAAVTLRFASENFGTARWRAGGLESDAVYRARSDTQLAAIALRGNDRMQQFPCTDDGIHRTSG